MRVVSSLVFFTLVPYILHMEAIPLCLWIAVTLLRVRRGDFFVVRIEEHSCDLSPQLEHTISASYLQQTGVLQDKN